jgi:diacylglycerol kinase (ATP)
MAEASLREAGLAFQSVSDTTDLAASIRRHARDVDPVVIGGGGSPNAAIPTLPETGLSLGVIPLGTANDFARTLGIPIVDLSTG